MKSIINVLIYILIVFSLLFLVKGETLIENETIQKYIKKDEIISYNLNINTGDVITKILIDLMIFSGDVIIQLPEKSENIHKYETANKIFLSIVTAEFDLTKFSFEVKANTYSFYSLRYTAVRKDEKESDLTNIIPINTNFLVTVYPFDEEGGLNMISKKLKFENKSNNNNPFLINFYSLNCAYKFYLIDKNDKKINLKSKDDYFVQDLITPEDEIYSTKKYTFVTEIIRVEQGTYNKKMCMIYASSTELDTSNQNLENYILVGENVPQKVIFNSSEVNNIKYLYEIPDIKNDLAIKFIPNARAEYTVNFYIKNENIRQIKVGTKQQEIIESSLYSKYCIQNEECKLIVEIKLNENNVQNKDFELETTIKSISIKEKYPSYLIKNKINREYLNYKSPNYYFTDIGQKISGEIIINYYRGNGMIFGKIVKKDQSPENNPEWRGIYEFPSRINGTLKYTSYLKKLVFTEEDTANCEDECYLLLSVVNNITTNNNEKEYNYDYEDYRYFGFDILIITNSLSIQSLNPLITLPLERYVIGSISQIESAPDFRRYYIINIPYDAEKVIFDLQSENVAMYVNVYLKDDIKFEDYKYPSKNIHFWDFYSKGKPQLFEISKQDVEKETNGQIDSLESISLTICVEAQSNDNDLSTIYALKYHLELNPKLNIYEIYSDQQTLCQTNKLDGFDKYNCLYLVKYNKNDIKYFLLLYPLLENQSTDFQIFADFVPRETYDLYKENELENLIPKSNAEFSPEKIKDKFLYINLNDKIDKYLYVRIQTDQITNIRLLSTFSTFDYSSVPNPSTSQLYIITNNEMKFSFFYKDAIIINLISILGGANIYWQDEEQNNIIHRLRGRDDRLSFISPPLRKDDSSIYNSLMIKNRNISSYNESQIPGGFIFYMTFYLRMGKINFDELGFGKSFNLNYRDTHFPLNLYFKLDNLQKDTNAFVTIYTMEGVERQLLEEKEFNVYATILSDNTIYKIRSNPEIDIKIDDLIPGIYDPSKRVCLISLKSSDMEKFYIPENESPNLVIRISKNSNKAEEDIYNHLSIEGTVIQDDSLIPVTEKVYQHGKLKKDSEKIVYKLSTNTAQNIMYIIFSSNSDLLDFKISMDQEDNEIINEFQKNKKTSEGRIITYIHSKPEKNNYIYLTIFRKDKANKHENLTNYVFKYINLDDISKIRLYQIRDSDIIHIKEDNSSHLIAVEYIGCENCLVTYYVNFILRSSLIKGENFDNIAVVQSEGITKEFENKNLKVVDNKVNLNINGLNENKDFAYIQVIAHINEDPINEYIAFKSIFIKEEGKKDPENTDGGNEGSSNTTFIVVISVVSFLFVAVLVTLIIVVLRFNIKNKDLLAQVNATSFQEERNEDENNANLLVN